MSKTKLHNGRDGSERGVTSEVFKAKRDFVTGRPQVGENVTRAVGAAHKSWSYKSGMSLPAKELRPYPLLQARSVHRGLRRRSLPKPTKPTPSLRGREAVQETRLPTSPKGRRRFSTPCSKGQSHGPTRDSRFQMPRDSEPGPARSLTLERNR